jgi:Catechol dioxygenase N terminus
VPYVTEDNLSDVVLERWNVVREVEPTQAEWATGIDWLTRTGQMCSQKRQEFIMASDVLGVSMLVDAIKVFGGSCHFDLFELPAADKSYQNRERHFWCGRFIHRSH